MRILIAEDDESSRKLLEKALKSKGYTVDSADNGINALNLARQAQPDLVISDILMPEMDGYALCRTFKSTEELCKIPFVFYTATYTDPRDEKFAMELGASRFIVKPMEITDFLMEIENVLSEHSKDRLPAPDKPEKDACELNQSYSEVLARKLQKKINELEEERKKLQESEERYRNIYNTAPLAFVIWDTDLRVTHWNKRAEEIFGWREEEVINQRLYDFLIPEKRENSFKEIMNALLQGHLQSNITEENLTKSGNSIICEWNISVTKNSRGDITGGISLALDITERRQMEESIRKLEAQLYHAQKMEAIGTLAGGIAHDFNNILQVILGYADMTKDDVPEQSRISNYLNGIIKAGKRAKDLVMQILTFCRGAEQERRMIYIHLIIKETLKLLRAAIPATIEIRENIDSQSGAVMADATQIHQIIMNLCTNAYHAMRKTGGILEVTLSPVQIEPANTGENYYSPPAGTNDYLPLLESTENYPNIPAGNYVKLTVSDTGHGMTAEILKRIFDPYFTTKKVGEGTGLGLSVVHGIIKSYNGHIAVRSNPGKGTTFDIFLPRIVDSASDSENIQKEESEYPVGTERILIVDDETATVMMLSEMLKSLGYHVTAITGSMDALKIFQNASSEFDLIISDMTMPEMTGEELSRKILNIRPDIPIILCTGYSHHIDKEKALKLGIKEYLMKPVMKRKLAETIRRVLDKK